MRKEFEVQETEDNVIKLAVRQPTYQDVEEADRIYAAKFATLAKESGGKLLLRSQLDKFLKETGAWTPEDDAKLSELNDKISELISKLKRGGIKLSEGRQLSIDIMDARKEIVKISRKRQVFDDVTIESIVENEKLDYIIYVCTVYADSGRNYWDSFEDMKNDKLSSAYRQASVTIAQMVYGYDPEFEKNLPENKWLKKYHFVDEELNYVDRKTGERVDKSGQPMKKLEEEAIKRIESLQGDIVEETPFIDDETNEPVTV